MRRNVQQTCQQLVQSYVNNILQECANFEHTKRAFKYTSFNNKLSLSAELEPEYFNLSCVIFCRCSSISMSVGS